jgi:hypothetical protein
MIDVPSPIAAPAAADTSVDKLPAEAEREPEAASALACVHLSSECQKLDRLMAQLSNEVLKHQRSEGAA